MASTQDWDNDRVAELLASADSSGDGKLQVGEFIKWIFAEDPKAIGLGFLHGPGHFFCFFSVLPSNSW